jgi:hypothetical protein
MMLREKRAKKEKEREREGEMMAAKLLKKKWEREAAD